MKVLHIDENHHSLIPSLEALGMICERDFTSPKAEIEQRIHQYQGLVLRSRFPIDESFLESARHLKFIARVGAGLENIDLEYARALGIEIISAPQGNANAVGEHTLALVLNLLNHICKSNAQVHQGKWLREANRGEELDGKTVGIIGYGNMGKAFARKLKGFDVEVLCYDIKEGLGDHCGRQVSKEIFMQKCDIVSLHVPQTNQTNAMIDSQFITEFKKPFWLINTARGSCVRIKDLLAGLDIGKVRGAALDVLEYEKSSFETLSESQMPDDFKALIASDKVILTPHIAGWSHQSNEKMARIIASEIEERFFSKSLTTEKTHHGK